MSGLELKLQMVVSHHVSAGDQTLGYSGRAASAPRHCVVFPVPTLAPSTALKTFPLGSQLSAWN